MGGPLCWKFLPGFGGWGREPVVAWVWISFCLHLLCPFLCMWCQSISYLWLYPRILFLLPPSPSPPSSQSNERLQIGLPRSKQRRVLACIQRSQRCVPLSALRCQFIKGSRCSGCARDNERMCAFQSVAREGKFRRCSLAIFWSSLHSCSPLPFILRASSSTSVCL